MKLLAVLIAGSMGCSWMATRKPEPLRYGQPPTCTTSRLAPGLDTYQAVGNGVVALAALADSGDTMHEGLAGMIATTALVSAAIFTASAVYGFNNTRQCREQHAAITRAFPAPPPPILIEESVEDVEIEREIDIKIRERIRPRR